MKNETLASILRGLEEKCTFHQCSAAPLVLSRRVLFSTDLNCIFEFLFAGFMSALLCGELVSDADDGYFASLRF
jgi:hypothetical protein